MNTAASKFDLGEGLRNRDFSVLLEKTQFSMKFYSLKMPSQMKSNDK